MKQVKKLKLDLYLMYILNIILISSVFIFFYLSGYFPEKNKSVNIDTSQLNLQEQEIAIRLVHSLKPEYYKLAKSITFVKDKNDMIDIDTIGQNQFNGKIKILYDGNYNNLRYVIEHE